MLDDHWDAVIVGSGFGGSVIAYKLAKAGFRVCLLERGKTYPPNSFPRSPLAIRNNFWDPSNGLYGLNNVWSFKGSAALVASGLGGGSLIYANVLIRKDAKWFDSSWPITREVLDPHYDRVERMLNAQQYPIQFEPFNRTYKSTEIQRAARSLGHEPTLVNLAVSFRTSPVTDPNGTDDIGNPPVVAEPIHESHPNLHGMTRYTCRLCGECDIGCNYGSKNTLDFNYLTEAKRHGAEIRPLSEVETFAPRGARGGYSVSYIAHDPASLEGIRRSKQEKLDQKRITISCDRLILAAGTMGSTFLLMNNKSSFPNLSPTLGSRFSTNGDVLGFLVDAKSQLRPDFGPVITTAIRFPDSLDGDGEVGRGFYVEDGGNPYLLSWMVELSGVLGIIRRGARFVWLLIQYRLGLSRTTNMGFRFAQLIGHCRRSSAAMPVLVMGRDVPSGNFSLKDGILDCDWTAFDSRKYYDRVTRELQKIAKAMGARYMENPDWRWNFQQVLTAHPLGGCPMGARREEGVVNNWGEVFGYPGLYVGDGSVMPGPVGPNPSLTIAAFADRIADGIIEQVRPERPKEKEAAMPTIVEFTEKMKGFVKLGEADFESGAQSGQPLTVRLRIRTEDIDFFLTDPDHRGQVEGYVSYEAMGGELQIDKGEFDCLVDSEGNKREMRYRLFFRDASGALHTLSGVKRVRDDGIQNIWRDCSTLFTRLFESYVDAEQEKKTTPEAAGIIHIRPLDFVEELTTFRSEGASFVEEFEAIAKFGRFFLGTLWDVYRPERGSIPHHGNQRHIPLFTLRGVKNAEISTHYFSTADHLGLSMLRFKRAQCKDIVVLLHGLTTSSDMFVMPEHENIVNYLLDHGFTDIWSFDWRGSMRYSYDLFPATFTMDDIALYDMPAAFSKIREIIGPEARVHVICHCVGSLTFMMSLYAKRIDGIASVISNSVSLTPRVPPWCRVKLAFAPMLFFESPNFNPRAADAPGIFASGKLLSKWVSLWHRECKVPACHMVSFMWGSGRPAAWMHENLNDVTHSRTGDLFGAVNINYYRHIRKMVSREEAVKMFPKDSRYGLLPNNYLDHAEEIDVPILFVTGDKNRVFLDSNVLTFNTIAKLKPDHRNELKVFAGYGHQDPFMGRNSCTDVFPVFLDFLERQSAQ